MIFKIVAVDDSGVNKESDEEEISYINGPEEEKSSGTDPLLVLVVLVSIGSIVTISGFGIKKVLDSRKLGSTDVSNLPSPPDTNDP